MINNNQKTTWIVDAVLFSGLIGAFFMDETGLPFHQWLGIAVGIISNYHLLSHWRWVKSVAGKFFEKTAGRHRLYFVIDSLIATGLITIVTTGVAMSTWLNLNLANYPVWKMVHITASIITVLVTLFKIGLHWKWIVKTVQRFSFRPAVQSPQWATARIPVVSNEMVGRREFLKMMGVVGAATVLASIKAIDELNDQATIASLTQTTESETTQSQSVSNTTEQSTSSTIATETSSDTTVQQTNTYATNLTDSQSSISCTSPCRDRCSYPGRCHRYTDLNSNELCDNGECA
jgi:hypothetical protein